MGECELRLATVLDNAYAATLKDQLLSRRGTALTIHAGDVARGGTLSFQVLMSAARTWKSDGLLFHIAAPSTVFAEAARTLGITDDQLQIEPAAS